MKEKRILQYGSLAGWPFTVAEALNDLGVSSENVIPESRDWGDLDRKLRHHAVISQSDSKKIVKILDRIKFMLSIPSKYSLVHYHASHLLRPSLHPLIEGKYLECSGVPMIVSFAGSDARIIEMARARNSYFFKDADPEGDRRRRKYLRDISKKIRFVATDCEMEEYVAPYFEKVFVFRQPVTLHKFRVEASEARKLPVLLHVPTNPIVKGTDYILKAVELLRAEGLKFEFKLIRQLSQEDFYKELANCDVYVDELRCGSYGMSAVEAMAMGKPTVTYVRPDLVPKYPPNMPLANANPDTVASVLRDLIGDEGLRTDLGLRGRSYVEKYHDSKAVASELMAAYKEIGMR